MPFEKNLRDTPNFSCLFPRILGEFEPAQTGHLSTVDAYKVRMLTFPGSGIRISYLEPPDMITQFGPNKEIHVGQVIQVSENSRLVEAQRYQFGSKLRMRHRR